MRPGLLRCLLRRPPRIAFVSSASSNHSSGRNGSTSATFNSSTANLIVVGGGYWTGGTGLGISDSLGSTNWTALTVVTGDGDPIGRLWYCLNPTGGVGAGHTVTVSGTNVYTGFEVACFSGVGAYASETGAAAASPGTITPTRIGSLVVCGLAAGSGTPTAIDSGFTISSASTAVSSQSYTSGLAYLVQGLPAGVNPAWTGATDPRAMAAVFTPLGV